MSTPTTATTEPSAKEQGRTVNFNPYRSKRWWNEQVLNPIVKQRNRARRWMIRSKTQEARECYDAWQFYFKGEVKRLKLELWCCLLAKSVKDPLLVAYKIAKPDSAYSVGFAACLPACVQAGSHSSQSPYPVPDLLILVPSADAYHPEIPAFEAKLRARYQVAPIAIEEPDLITYLSAPIKPKAVIYADGSLISDNEAWLVDPLLAYLDAGGTLILAYDFFCFVGPPRTDLFIRDQLGLPWTFGDYSRKTCRLLPAFSSAFQSPVPRVYHLSAVFLRNVDPDARVYGPEWGNMDQTAVAFQRYKGKGFIGYIGDIEKKEGAQDVIIAMLDRVIKSPKSSPLTPDAPEFQPAPRPTGRGEGYGTNRTQQVGPAKGVESDMCGDQSTHWGLGCKIVSNGSIDCQQSNWLNRNLFYSMPQTEASNSGAVARQQNGARCELAQVFEEPGALLADTSQEETIRRVVDVYRIRTKDQRSFGGKTVGLQELQGGVTRDHFEKFLCLAESRAGLLPDWWDASARETCLKVALDEKGRCFIGHAIEKSDIQEAYDDPVVPLAMQLVGEVVYGSPIGQSAF